jgi:hypothetical protein
MGGTPRHLSRSAWSGRIVSAKPVRSYVPKVNGMSTTAGDSGRLLISPRRAPLTG